jgi:hypothetical protein
MVLPDLNFTRPEEQEEEVNNPPASQTPGTSVYNIKTSSSLNFGIFSVLLPISNNSQVRNHGQ